MTASPLFEFALLSFISLFTMVNPIGVIPVYTAMTAKLSPQESHRVARKASLTALFILLAFALTGQWIFRFFSISTNSLRVVGGVIFFLMGYEMLQARLSRTQFDDETTHAVVPLAGVGVGENGVEISDGGPGDKGFTAVEDVLIPLAAGGGTNTGHIGTGFRFGEAVGGFQLGADQARQPVLPPCPFSSHRRRG